MTAHRSGDEWDDWQITWRLGGASASAPAPVMATLQKARRSLLLVLLAEGVIAAAALAVTALALMHAAAAYEVVLGLVVGSAIALLWIRRVMIRHSEHGADSAGSERYLEYMRGLRVQQQRLARFTWIVLALELAFLGPWWARGSQIHPRTLTSVTSWLSMYTPILAMIALFAWSYRLGRNAKRESQLIEELSATYREGSD